MERIKPDFTAQGGSFAPERKTPKYTVAVFAASSTMFDNGHVIDAVIVGRALAEKNYKFIYGGGSRGLMGISSQAALEAGGEICGYMMACFAEKGEYPQKKFEAMCVTIAERKQKMLLAADAYIALGGGLGTLDEIVEAGIEQYMGGFVTPPLPRKPIILVNRNGIYDPLMALLDKMIEQGSAKPEVRNFFYLARNGEDAINTLEKLRAQAPQLCVNVGNVGTALPSPEAC